MSIPDVTAERGLVKIVKDYNSCWLEPIRAKKLAWMLRGPKAVLTKRVCVTMLFGDGPALQWAGTEDEAKAFADALAAVYKPIIKEMEGNSQ